MNLTNITAYINGNAAAIVDNLEHETIEVYKFLMMEFRNTNVLENLPFQFFFRSFYRLDNAGLTKQFKTEYFKVLEAERTKEEPDIREILERLKVFQNLKGQHNMQFSFATKLLNTINNRIPIYDSEVARVFGYKRPLQTDFTNKLDAYLLQHQQIRKDYEDIVSGNLVEPVKDVFDLKFGNHNLPEIKLLDFIFWSAGKIMKKHHIKESIS